MMRGPILFLTGRPGVGKTSVLLRVVDSLRESGVRVGGMVSREARRGGVRVGFEILDIGSGERGWLAHVDQPTGPKVSKYRVNLSDLERVGVGAISSAIDGADVIAIDEVGPMELHSQAFKRAVATAVECGKPVVGTIHHRARDPLIDQLKSGDDVEIVRVTHANRGELHKAILDKFTGLLGTC